MDLATKPSAMVVHGLTVDQAPVAVEIGFNDGQTYHSFLGAFHADFASEGPGVALMLAVVQWCVEQGLSTYDLLAPDTDFKRTWSDHQRVVYSATVPTGIRGRLAAPLLRDARARLKALGEELPTWLREPLLRQLDKRQR